MEKLHAGHIPALVALEQAAFGEDAWYEVDFNGLLALPMTGGYAYMEDETLCGYVLFLMKSGEAEILSLAVHPHKQGTGLGKTLLLQTFSHFSQHGVGQVFLEVRPGNVAAKGLYSRLGGIKVGEHKAYYDPTPSRPYREDAHVYRFVLPAVPSTGD